MKPLATILTASIVGALAAFVTVKNTGAPSQAVAEESVYARVLRTGTIRCGYFVWPPYIAKDPNTGKISGVNHDYMEAIARFLNLKVDWVAEVGAGEVSTALNANKFDVMCTTMWPGGATRLLTHTDPILFTNVYAYVRANDTRFDGNLSQLNQPNVIAVTMDGDVSADIARTDFPQAKTFALSQMDDASMQIESVRSKKADVTFLDKSFAEDYMKKAPNVIKPVANVPPLKVFGEHYALKLGEHDFKNILDTAILTINNSALGAEILKNYPHLGSTPTATAAAK